MATSAYTTTRNRSASGISTISADTNVRQSAYPQNLPTPLLATPGMSPHRYLWLRRMTLARHALVSADPTARTVAEIATDHGFGSWGGFRRFRKLFGESPSVTLRRLLTPKLWMIVHGLC